MSGELARVEQVEMPARVGGAMPFGGAVGDPGACGRGLVREVGAAPGPVRELGVPRVACVRIPGFALRVLEVMNPRWRGAPVAVVERDEPNGPLVHLNASARAKGLVPGMRLGHALDLVPGLRASAVPAHVLGAWHSRVLGLLSGCSPVVEPVRPGVYLLDATGMVPLYPSLADWAWEVRSSLRAMGLDPVVVVGFGRAAVMAIAAGADEPGVLVLQSREREGREVSRVGVERVLDDPSGLLPELGIRTVGDLARVPRPGLVERLGGGAALDGLAGGPELPLSPSRSARSHVARASLPHGEADSGRITAMVGRLMEPMVRELARAGLAVGAVWLGLRRGARLGWYGVRPATPTMDPSLLRELVSLRIGGLRGLGAITEVHVRLDPAEVQARQVELPLGGSMGGEDSARQEAAQRAISLVQAELGPASVVVVSAGRGHLPGVEAVPWRGFAPGRARAPAPCAVRGLLPAPEPVPTPAGRALAGPFPVSTGWWRGEARREYWLYEGSNGELVWYFNERSRWYRHMIH